MRKVVRDDATLKHALLMRTPVATLYNVEAGPLDVERGGVPNSLEIETVRTFLDDSWVELDGPH